MIDRWGFSQVQFDLEPVKLLVIPRAKYATWLVEKYLAGSRTGTLTIISNIEALKPLYGLKRGVEYYGNQVYQPGDNLKNIDWKHSFKYNELIVKEFTEFHGQSAIILINLVAGSEEEADKLAYNILITALSLAVENIPAALAVYNQESVKITTETLTSQKLIIQALKTVNQIENSPARQRYLKAPEVSRLRSNIRRLEQVSGQPSRVLRELLQFEFHNLKNEAGSSPVTRAMASVKAKVNQECSVISISRRNHDAEALAFTAYALSQKGQRLIDIGS
jgi:hypothetical protein